MYAGHVAIALGARGLRRDLPLWILVAASQGCDWVELVVHRMTPRSSPDVYSHAVPFVLIPAAIMAVAVWGWKRALGPALTVLAVYLSHPLADLVTGVKPLWLGGPHLGLGFIERPIADLVAQTVVCVLGFVVYQRSLPELRRRSIVAFAPLVFLLGLQGAGDLSRLEFRRRRVRRLERAVAPLRTDSSHIPRAYPSTT